MAPVDSIGAQVRGVMSWVQPCASSCGTAAAFSADGSSLRYADVKWLEKLFETAAAGHDGAVARERASVDQRVNGELYLSCGVEQPGSSLGS